MQKASIERLQMTYNHMVRGSGLKNTFKSFRFSEIMRLLPGVTSIMRTSFKEIAENLNIRSTNFLFLPLQKVLIHAISKKCTNMRQAICARYNASQQIFVRNTGFHYFFWKLTSFLASISIHFFKEISEKLLFWALICAKNMILIENLFFNIAY